MTVEASIHVALMSRVETLQGFTLVWPSTGGAEPSTEHVKVFHMPNDNRRILIGRGPIERAGILQLSLFSVLGKHEAVYIQRAGLIAEHFPQDLKMTSGDVTVQVSRTDVGRGRSDGQQWLTPVSVYYRGYA